MVTTDKAARPTKALVKVGYGCNDHCSFCHTLDVRHIQGEAVEVHRKIRRAKALGHSMVVLSGGEPTIRPELTAWAKHAATIGLDFGLVTNGRMLSYPKLVDQLLRYRLRYVYLSLHGGTAKVHNLMVRSQAFEQTFGAVAQLSGRGIDFSVNCVITKHNVDHLKGVVDKLLPYPDVPLKFSMVEPKGGGERLFDHLIPPVEQVARRVCEAIAYGESRAQARASEDAPARGRWVSHGGIPLCLMPGFEDRYDDLRTHGFDSMTEVGEPDFFPVDDDNKIQPPKCARCSLSGACPGLYKGYYEQFGDKELRPVTDQPRSNSFNYTLETSIADTGPRCAVLATGLAPWEYGRHLFVKRGDLIDRYRSRTRDFSDQEISAVKHERGQVYLDVSTKTAPDDFARDLVQLRRSSTCDTCPEFVGCTGLFVPSSTSVFERDDARVRKLLGTLTGRVLDVGCGEGPYSEILAPRVASGAVDYVGIDPHEDRIAALRERWPWAELIATTAERLAADNESSEVKLERFDHIVVLRSWNHMREPAVFLGALDTLLAPGGTLTLVDNEAFGMARSSEQSDRAESGPAAFEHYRNDGSEDAETIVAELGLPLELLAAESVRPGRSNQWMLHYRWRADS